MLETVAVIAVVAAAGAFVFLRLRDVLRGRAKTCACGEPECPFHDTCPLAEGQAHERGEETEKP